MSKSVINYDYASVPTVRAFCLDRVHRVKALMGPFGSGKSSGCVMDLFNIACSQQPDSGGVRRTRFSVVRNTYQMLRDTTKRTIDEWLPFAQWYQYDHRYLLDFKLNDGTIVHSEWLLRALDRPDQVKNLLSLEITAAWLNEAREIAKEIYEGTLDRCGRYPKRDKDYGPTWHGLLMDTNPPDTESWFYDLFENKARNDVKVGNMVKLFRQPSGLSPQAENLPNLIPGYYDNMVIGKDPDYIKVYVEGEYGYLREGKPVFASYRDSLHCATEELMPLKGQTLIIGLDFGLTPAAVITQQDARGRVLILDEVFLPKTFIDIREFMKSYVKPLLRSKKYQGFTHTIIGDPAGNTRSQVDSRTVYQELKQQNMVAKSAKTNSLQARISAVNHYLTHLVEGKPSLIVSPQCKNIRKGFMGDYQFRRMRITGERYMDVPDKNDSSHIMDAIQYACMEHSDGFSALESARYSATSVRREAPPVTAWT